MSFKFGQIINEGEEEAMPEAVAIAIALEQSGDQMTIHLWDDAGITSRLREDAQLRAAIVAAVQHRLNEIAGVI